MGKVNIIIIAILLIGVIIVGILLMQGKNESPTPDISEIINPSQAHQLCSSKTQCTNEEVTIEGKTNFYSISDEKKTITLRFENYLTLEEEIAIKEKNQLINEGTIIKARIKGKLNYVDYSESLRCTNDGCMEYLEIIINPEEIQFIETSECKKGYDNCFDNSRYELKASEAYENLMASEVGTKGGREATGSYNYDFENNYWRFQISDPDCPGGCSDYCHVYKDKIIFNRNCARDIYDETEEEIISH